jgi:hypothetical protein
VPDIKNLGKDTSKENDIGNQRKNGRRTVCIQKGKGDYRSNFWNKIAD